MNKVKSAETLGDVRDGGHELEAICRHGSCRYRCGVDLPRTIQSVGATQSLLPTRAHDHFTDRMRCPSCKRRGMNLWLVPCVEKKKPLAPIVPPKQPNYRVISHGRRHPYDFNMIATADNLFVARAAYAAAAHFYEGYWITLMQGAFLLDDNKRDGPPKIMQAEDYREMRAAESGRTALSILPTVVDEKTSQT